MAVNKAGKFTKKEDKTIRLLEEAFAMDCPVTEACLHANISTPTYYEWIKADPKLEERFNRLRETPYLLARKTIIKSIETNPQSAFEYMKRKKKGEFGDEPNPLVVVNNNYTDEQIAAIASRAGSDGRTPSQKKPD